MSNQEQLTSDQVPNSSPLIVRKPKDDDAGCNFCTSKVASHEVYSLHPSRNLHINFCRQCMESLVCQA